MKNKEFAMCCVTVSNIEFFNSRIANALLERRKTNRTN